ncbi:MAG TPA: inositol monophosphatase family protein [Solirubrobacteraceae bacterium]|nr:inositol monophosphatase family protein [Solirubrobacteraceae bacterium]
MTATDTALAADWLGLCRRAVGRIERLFARTPGIEERAEETGTRGAGGDDTLVLDRSAERVVFDELDRLHASGACFTALSEERGEARFGADGADATRIVIDPIDGSLNAKRDGAHYALSVAVADGTTMADVRFAFVHDFGAREQWWARSGEGAWRARGERPPDGERLDPTRTDRRSRSGRLEVVGIESADPRWLREQADELADVAHRLRALGTIAVSLCAVAAARHDGLVTLRRARGVDSAAGQLIVREAGGLVSFPDCADPLGAPLDATPASRVVAARSERGLRELERVGA